MSPEELREQAENVRSWSEPHDCDDIPCPIYGDDCPWQQAGALDLQADLLEQETWYAVFNREGVRLTDPVNDQATAEHQLDCAISSEESGPSDLYVLPCTEDGT